MDYVMETSRLTKSFAGKAAVNNVSMHIKKGEIYGFLGPNGAGKTTVMKLAANLIKPESGEVKLFGEPITPDSHEIYKRMGAIIEYPAFYDRLTARENMELHLRYMGYHSEKAIPEAMELAGLADTGRKQVKDFSLGMKQRLGIARAIATKPEFLMLDEPINGLDPIGINDLRKLFKILSREMGVTLFISSHILKEIEQIADTVGVIDNGLLRDEVSMDSVRGSMKAFISIKTDEITKASYVLSHQLGISNFKVMDEASIRIYDTHLSQKEIAKVLVMNEVSLEAVTSESTSLEDFFLKIVQGGKANA